MHSGPFTLTYLELFISSLVITYYRCSLPRISTLLVVFSSTSFKLQANGIRVKSPYWLDTLHELVALSHSLHMRDVNAGDSALPSSRRGPTTIEQQCVGFGSSTAQNTQSTSSPWRSLPMISQTLGEFLKISIINLTRLLPTKFYVQFIIEYNTVLRKMVSLTYDFM
jgi:hypothetical protein